MLKAIRSTVSQDFQVILRLSQWREGDRASPLAETPQILGQWLRALAEAGADAFHLSQQLFWEPAFPEVDKRLDLAGWAKKLTGLPAITVGSVGLSVDVRESFKGRIAKATPLDDLLGRLERNEFDLVAWAGLC